MAERATNPKEKMKMSTRAAVAVMISAVSLLAFAAAAQAKEEITFLSVGSSQTQAGAHPDLSASFTLEDPGEPESAKNISANLPAGVFGNPGAILKCKASDFVLNECGSDTQAGIISIYANHNGDPNFLLGTAPLYNMVRVSEDEPARLEFVAPDVNIPVAVPVTVRSGSDYGLRITVSGIPQSIPVSHVDLSVWGVPAKSVHDHERFPKGSPGSPLHRQPEPLHRPASPGQPRSPDLPGPVEHQ
jgi:hypothetical protein